MQMEREKRLPVNRQNVDQMAHMLATDTALRTVVVTVPGMGFNLIYAVFNGGFGFCGHKYTTDRLADGAPRHSGISSLGQRLFRLSGHEKISDK